MALSRRLFIGGLLTAAAAPAIVTSKGFREAICGRGQTKFVQVLDELAWYTPAGTVTGRMTSSEPAWQELRTADPRYREMLKRISFCQRYGTKGHLLFTPEKREKRLILTDLDYSRLEARAQALYRKPMA